MEVKYISEINEFYDWLETNPVPKSAIALWHALMHMCNKSRWKPSFAVAMSTLEIKTGFKRSELFKARNILKQGGRIKWSERGGCASAIYSIVYFCVHNTDANGDANGDAIDTQMVTQPVTIIRLDKSRVDKKTSSARLSPAVAKKEKVIEHWEKLVDTWMNFYLKNFGEKATFEGAGAKNLKILVIRLEKRSAAQGHKWTEERAIRYLEHLLATAMQIAWLKDHFLLPNLVNQYDTIINNQNNGTNSESVAKSGKVSTRSAGAYNLLEKLDGQYSNDGDGGRAANTGS